MEKLMAARARCGNRQLLSHGFRALVLKDVNTLELDVLLLSCTHRNGHDAKYHSVSYGSLRIGEVGLCNEGC